MKAFCACLLTLTLVVGAQTFPLLEQTPDVVVLKAGWKQYRKRSDLNPSSTTEEDDAQRRARLKREMQDDAARNLGVKPPPQQKSSTPRALPNRSQEGYQYTASVKNEGTKTVRAIGWEYIFSDPVTQNEIARHRFRTRKQIRPGRKAELVEFILAPPSRVLDASRVERSGDTFSEQVIITSIEYTDGSRWQRPRQP